jgi:uncharacterized protein YraI
MHSKRTVQLSVVLVIVLALSLVPILTSAQSVLPYGSGVVGQITAQSPLLIYTFNGSANDLVTVQAIGMTAGFSPTLSLNSPTQQQLGNSSSDPFTPGAGSARIDVRLPQDGAYTLLVGSLNGQGGDFLIRVDGQTLPASVPLSNAPLTTSISVQLPMLAFGFVADPGSPSSVSFRGDFAFGVSVFNGAGRLVAALYGGSQSSVHFTAPSGAETYDAIVFALNGEGGTLSTQLDGASSSSSSSSSNGQSSDSSSSSSSSSSSADPTVCTVTANNPNTNVRNGPGTNYRILGQFQSSIATGYNADWYVINYGSGSGWAYSGVVTVSGTCNNLTYVNAPPAPPPAATSSSSGSDNSSGQGSSPTATQQSSGSGGNTGSQPTHTPPPPTTAPVQTAPNDGDYRFDVDRDHGGTFSQVISYPDGDTSDRVEVHVNLGQLSPDNARNVSLLLTCSGTGTENVAFTRGSPNAQRYSCGDTITYRYAHPYGSQNYYVFIDSGSGSYVNYTLTATTSQ